ncbi:MAG: phosphate/phosphite/phosphonate ABC transporter substrate-binding protein, partial [Rhodobacterales bacterium]
MKTLLSVLAASTVMFGAVQAQEITEFNIGILGGENAQDRLTNQECFRAKIEEALGVPVKLFAPADYDGVIQGLLGGSIDYAWLGASAYAKVVLTDPAAVELKLTKQNLDESTGYYSIGFARADSGITSMDDAKGKIFAFADPNSAS